MSSSSRVPFISRLPAHFCFLAPSRPSFFFRQSLASAPCVFRMEKPGAFSWAEPNPELPVASTSYRLHHSTSRILAIHSNAHHTWAQYSVHHLSDHTKRGRVCAQSSPACVLVGGWPPLYGIGRLSTARMRTCYLSSALDSGQRSHNWLEASLTGLLHTCFTAGKGSGRLPRMPLWQPL